MGFSLRELADLCGARLEGDGERIVRGPATLDRAGADEVSFLANPRYAGLMASTRAAGVVVAEDAVVERRDLALLRAEDPNRCFTRVVAAFAAQRPVPEPGVRAGAHVDPGARLGADVSIGPGAVVERDADVGDGAVLLPGSYVGVGASIGAGSTLGAGAALLDGVTVGARCTIHAGAVVGADGFGFEPTREGWVKIPQCGTVVVEDDVEIGANTTIDRARFGATRIGRGTKIDNLVHVAHNVEIGADSVVAAQAGIAGSARIDERVVIGGQVGVAGHVRIASGVRLAGQSGAYGDITEPGDYLDTPARPRREALRRMASAGRAEELAKRVRELERRLERLEGDGR
ncbi:MAG: UDP-3-O-(3-hydroxymyristoyl)glucosamine N-acyltransferase [Planctomycetota bacterium]